MTHCNRPSLPQQRRLAKEAHVLVTMPSITTPPEWPTESVGSRWAMLPSPRHCRLDLRGFKFSGPPLVRLRYGLVTRGHPDNGLVGRLQNPGFPTAILLPKLRGSDCYPGGTGIPLFNSRGVAIEEKNPALVKKCFYFPHPMKRLVVFRPLIDPQAQYCNFLCREGLRCTHGCIKAIFNHHI